MKTITKEVLEEIISYKETIQPKKLLIKAEKKMGHEALNNSIGWLLHWQKMMDKGLDDNYQGENYLLDQKSLKEYNVLFDNCPQLKEIFSLNEKTMSYNDKLNDKEKKQIKQYIDNNYKLKFRIRRN